MNPLNLSENTINIISATDRNLVAELNKTHTTLQRLEAAKASAAMEQLFEILYAAVPVTLLLVVTGGAYYASGTSAVLRGLFVVGSAITFGTTSYVRDLFTRHTQAEDRGTTKLEDASIFGIFNAVKRTRNRVKFLTWLADHRKPEVLDKLQTAVNGLVQTLEQRNNPTEQDQLTQLRHAQVEILRLVST